ncbi:FAD-dependent monooxygenase [Shimia sp. Alg240-R146]|uniref:FAD-dependent monooxygenase n=1 Tax=Shimia sp. Alg240-R146 TaxID=2993449 RepID=UPI0022E0ECA1|nr:FAD-dependent monooxygenase [Shimia sp. Alg240-R146]
MDLNGLKIRVIGAGIGGLTAALVLRERGADVTVLEQAEAITEVGAGLQVSPNGMAVLRALGLEAALQVRAVRGQAVELRDYARGRLVSRLNLGALGDDAPYYFVHRFDLIDILAEAVRAAGVKIRLLQKVETVVPGDVPRVVLAHGQEVSVDLVIGADGLHSKLRPVLNGTVAPFFTRQVAWRATVPNTVGHGPVAKVHMGPRRHVVSYPLRGGEMVNIVAVQERSGWHEEGWHIADDPANLRGCFSDFEGETKALLANVETVRKWGLFRHPVAPIWHKGHSALLGDAAHPTLPFMAQGAVMAMEDAWVLGDALAKADDIEAGLAAYQMRRQGRVRRVVDTASKNARRYHLSAPPVRMAAHLGLTIASTLAPKAMMGHFDWIYRYDVTKDS